MYETLTALLPRLKAGEHGTWVIDRVNDGSPQHPRQFPFVDYSRTVTELEYAIYNLVDARPDLGLTHYYDILAAAGLKWDMDSMLNADVSRLDGPTVMALLVGALRAERFCDGALLRFLEGGAVARWLERLRELDASAEGTR